MTDKEILLQGKTLYIRKVKEVDAQIAELQEERKEYIGVVRDYDKQLEELRQPSLF